MLWEKLVLKRTIWNLRVLFCTTRLRLLVPIFENGQCIRQLLESATGSVLNTGDPTVFENCVPLMSPKTDLSKTVRDRMLSVVRVATIFLPQVEITWARAWRALTCSDIVVCCWTLSVSWLGYSKPSPSFDMSCCLWTCTVEK